MKLINQLMAIVFIVTVLPLFTPAGEPAAALAPPVGTPFQNITAVTAGEESGDTADGRDGNARKIVNAAVGHTLLQQRDDAPAVDHGLELSGGAEVFEELPALGFRAQSQQRPAEREFRLPAACRVAGGLHVLCTNVIACCYISPFRRPPST